MSSCGPQNSSTAVTSGTTVPLSVHFNANDSTIDDILLSYPQHSTSLVASTTSVCGNSIPECSSNANCGNFMTTAASDSVLKNSDACLSPSITAVTPVRL